MTTVLAAERNAAFLFEAEALRLSRLCRPQSSGRSTAKRHSIVATERKQSWARLHVFGLWVFRPSRRKGFQSWIRTNRDQDFILVSFITSPL